jgi:dTDP-4-dehydrorhamnose reductase
MKKVLVTGAKGQLGRCIKDAAINFPFLEINFVSRKDLDIDDFDAVQQFFNQHKFDYCINAAAYTNVEKAESDSDQAFLTNAEAVKNLANICAFSKTTLLHASTDYVFNGKKESPYLEEDQTNPINVYGASKLKGEEYIQESGVDYFIFRTSWLYSQYGHNFLNTILRFGREEKSLTITTEQIGTPTNANDLALVFLNVIVSESKEYGLYHFSNSGKATWFDFAEAIFEENPQFDATKLAKTDYYRTFAARPQFSVLETTKYINTFNNQVIDWRKSLSNLLH